MTRTGIRDLKDNNELAGEIVDGIVVAAGRLRTCLTEMLDLEVGYKPEVLKAVLEEAGFELYEF